MMSKTTSPTITITSDADHPLGFAVGIRLLIRRHRRLAMGGMKSRVIAAVRGVVDSGSRQPDRFGHAAATEGDVSAAHSERQARPRARDIDRQSWEQMNPLIESQSHAMLPLPSPGSQSALLFEKIAQDRGGLIL